MAAGIFLHVFAVFAIQVFRDWGGDFCGTEMLAEALSVSSVILPSS